MGVGMSKAEKAEIKRRKRRKKAEQAAHINEIRKNHENNNDVNDSSRSIVEYRDKDYLEKRLSNPIASVAKFGGRIMSLSVSSSANNKLLKSEGSSGKKKKLGKKSKSKGKQSLGPQMLSGRTPSFIANEVKKKARNASFGTKVKLGFFVDNDTKQFTSMKDAQEIFLESINNSELLSKCSESLKEELFRYVVPIFVKPGDLLFEQGNYGQILYVVIKGHLSGRRIDKSGENIKKEYEAGSALAEYSVLMNSPHDYTVIVRKGGLLLAVHRLQYQMAAMKAGAKSRSAARQIPLLRNASTGDSTVLTSEINVDTSNNNNNHHHDDHALHIPLFAPLTKDQLALIQKALIVKDYVPGEKIIGATENSPGLFIVIEGEISLRTPKAVYRANDNNNSIASINVNNNKNTENDNNNNNDNDNNTNNNENNNTNNNKKKDQSFRKFEDLFEYNENTEIEWRGPGDYFSEASLLSGGDVPLGVDAIASSHQTVKCLLLPTASFVEIVGGENEKGAPILELINHIHIVRLLVRNPIFAKLSEIQITKLARNIELRKFGQNDAIIEANRPVSETGGFFIVTQGLAKLIPNLRQDFDEDSSNDSDGTIDKFNDEMDNINNNKNKKNNNNSNNNNNNNDDDNSKRDSNKMAHLHHIADTVNNAVDETRDKVTNAAKTIVNEFEKVEEALKHKMHNFEDVLEGNSFIGFNPNILTANTTPQKQKKTKKKLPAKINLLNKDNLKDIPDNVDDEKEFKKKLKEQIKKEEDEIFLPGLVDEDAMADDYAVLLGGDSFGEDAILLENPTDDIVQVASVYAMGAVTVGFVTRETLVELGILDLILSAIVEADEGATSAFNSKTLGHSISQKFLAFDKVTISINEGSTNGSMLNVSGSSFKIIRRLHHTELTNVWIALHKKTGQLLVIKSMNVAVANKQGLGQYVFTEQTVLSQLHSPFITNLITAWEESSLVLVGLEPALGGDLEQIIKKVAQLYHPRNIEESNSNIDPNELPPPGELGCFSFELVKFNAACAVLALKHLYEHNICHRDLKPGNMIMDHHGYIKIMDFGIAKQLPAGTSRTYTLCGSPHYMSPELASAALGQSSGYSIANDWWALGIILYQMSLGFTPFAEDAPAKRKTIKKYLQSVHKNNLRKESMKSIKSKKKRKQSAKQANKNKSKKYFDTFNHINSFAKRKKGSQDDIFEIFNLTVIKDERWRYLHSFINKLLSPSPISRLGSSVQGPREAMNHELFKGKDDHALHFDKLLQRNEIAPFIPKKLIVDLNNVAILQEETVMLNQNSIAEDAASNTENDNNALENKVRGTLENDHSGFMGNQLQKAERTRRQLMMNRHQQLKRIAYKQGRSISDIGSTKKNINQSTSLLNNPVIKNATNNPRKQLEAQIIHKTTVKEALHHIFTLNHHQKKFQRNHRRKSNAVDPQKQLQAVIRLQQNFRTWKKRAHENAQKKNTNIRKVMHDGVVAEVEDDKQY